MTKLPGRAPVIELFLAAILAGIITGAPFGVAGAMVADAALLGDKNRLYGTIAAAVLGNTLLAYLISLAGEPAKVFFERYESGFFLTAGSVVIVMGICIAAANTGRGRDSARGSGGMQRVAGPVSVFFITLLHPGSIVAFLFVTALFTMRFQNFSEHRMIYVAGMLLGALAVFSPVGILFWTIQEKANFIVSRIRYGIAFVLVCLGGYFIIKGM